MKLPIIVNEAGKLYIEAVPQLAWGRGKECTFAGALEAALAITAVPFPYDHLMGWSALAFRSRWYRGDSGRLWCASSPVGETPEELALLRQATGWELPVSQSAEDAAAVVAHEIRAGRPLLAYTPQLNVGVVFGFEEDGRILLLRDYASDEPSTRLPIGQRGPFLGLLGMHHERLDTTEALFTALERAVANWHRSHQAAAEGRFWYGRAALLKWRDDLGAASQLEPEARRLLFFVNWWVFDSLVDARAAAERFLRRHVGLLQGRQQRHLLQAAALFASEARFLRQVVAEKQAFFGPWTGRTIERWTPEVRERERATLGRILELETEAFGELENLLSVPAPAGGVAELAASPV